MRTGKNLRVFLDVINGAYQQVVKKNYNLLILLIKVLLLRLITDLITEQHHLHFRSSLLDTANFTVLATTTSWLLNATNFTVLAAKTYNLLTWI